jgi:hypothetical protein
MGLCPSRFQEGAKRRFNLYKMTRTAHDFSLRSTTLYSLHLFISQYTLPMRSRAVSGVFHAQIVEVKKKTGRTLQNH